MTFINSKYFLIIFGLLLSQNALAQEVQVLTLESFLEAAKAKNLNRAAAERDLKNVQLDAQIFAADLKPQVTGFANFPNYSRSFQEVVQPNGTIAFQPVRNNNSSISFLATQRLANTGGLFFLQTNLQRFDDFENDFFQYNGLPFRLGFQQDVFGFNPWKWNKKALPLEQSRATKKYAYDLEQIKVEATRLFFDLLVAHQDFEIAQSNLNNNEELLKIAEERFALGKISENDRLQLQLESVSAAKNKVAAAQAVRFASIALTNYLGEAWEGELMQAAIPQVNTELIIDIEKALSYAQKNRYETDDYLLQLLEAERNLEQAQKEAGINLNFNASIGYSRSAKDVETIYSNPQNEQFLQLSLSVPILNWGKNKALVAQQNVQKTYTERAVQQAQMEFATDLKNTVYRLQTVQNQLKLAQQQQEIAQKRFDIAKQSFVLGAISITELGIAQQEKDFALRDFILTLRNYWQSYYELRRNTLYDFENDVRL